jgi:hypothetical protein
MERGFLGSVVVNSGDHSQDEVAPRSNRVILVLQEADQSWTISEVREQTLYSKQFQDLYCTVATIEDKMDTGRKYKAMQDV